MGLHNGGWVGATSTLRRGSTPRERRGRGSCRAMVLAAIMSVVTITAGCGPTTGGDENDRADGDVAATPGIIDSPTAANALSASDADATTPGISDVPGDDGDDLEVIDIPGDDIEDLLDATRIVFFSTGTLESMCEAPELFTERITGGPQIFATDNVRLATRAFIAVRDFAPGVPIDVKVYGPDGDVAASLSLPADGNGCAVGTWIVSPDRPLGDHRVTATDGQAGAELVVPVSEPDGRTLIVSPNEVGAGEDVTVTLAGYAPYARLELVLYALASGSKACGAVYPADCWRFRAAWRTRPANARGGLTVRLPTRSSEAGETYLVTTNPRPEMSPRDAQNDRLMFSIVDRQRLVLTPEAPVRAPDGAVLTRPVEGRPLEVEPRSPGRLRPERGIRLATPVVVP